MTKVKKAFTLVELLVVIAILAVLASVSIVGYTAFTRRAVQNNALSELTQVKTLVTGAASTDENGLVVNFGGSQIYVFNYDGNNNQYSFAPSSDEVELNMNDETHLTGIFSFDVSSQRITYTLKSGNNTAALVCELNTGTILN